MAKKKMVKMKKIKTVTELFKLKTFDERVAYLRLDGSVGMETFGFDRYMNQQFYSSREWKQIRNHVIARDLGRDLGLEGYEIYGKVLVHHLNPLIPDDIIHSSEFLLDPEYLITTTLSTHNLIHYGIDQSVPFTVVERKPFDTCPWKG